MEISPAISCLEAEQVAKLLKNSEDYAKTLVVDVRDDDFEGGHIRGCVNLTTDNFEDDDDVDEVIAKYCADKDRVIVHCMLSQQRGPFCARRLARRLAVSDLGFKPDVFVLSRGFKRFARMYYGDADLCEGIDNNVWG